MKSNSAASSADAGAHPVPSSKCKYWKDVTYLRLNKAWQQIMIIVSKGIQKHHLISNKNEKEVIEKE